jgi:hypothetical protein
MRLQQLNSGLVLRPLHLLRRKRDSKFVEASATATPMLTVTVVTPSLSQFARSQFSDCIGSPYCRCQVATGHNQQELFPSIAADSIVVAQTGAKPLRDLLENAGSLSWPSSSFTFLKWSTLTRITPSAVASRRVRDFTLQTGYD